MTVTDTPAVARAIETTDQVLSHLHPEGSRDVADHPVPAGREEIWRFTPMRRLRGLHQDAPFVGALELDIEAPDGVTVGRAAADDAVRGSSGYLPTDRITARAWEAAERVDTVQIAQDVVLDEPAIVRHTGSSGESARAGHLVVVAGKFSKATVVLDFEGTATLADTIEFVVEDGAQLTVVTLDDWADDALHHSSQHARIGRDAHFKHIAVTFGGDLVRTNTSVSYAGPGGEAELLGIYFADAGQHIEHRLFVDHDAPKTKSNVDYKGALQGKDAHTVWIGDVLIRKVAEGIETYESNRNLVLTEGCRADSVPNLEIETGEIEGAGHASTTGRFDDEQLFYLQSRGIPAEEARRLVVRGFFADIIRKIGVPSIEEKLIDAVEAELARSNA
ncbi:Fe-S cluster assembly protein SufD [Blastococcus sp. Marseille-P5729]|uniref:Fe-S cluster assembly protein SufD n=1 Tax=Blastococcus sp. Marseille-P5729 TaxID=2086582 RepID=UPI0018FEDBD1|nr:Fe-S cluster assembly protein SufD [Blastococcus sp. Marseille-P5729]